MTQQELSWFDRFVQRVEQKEVNGPLSSNFKTILLEFATQLLAEIGATKRASERERMVLQGPGDWRLPIEPCTDNLTAADL